MYIFFQEFHLRTLERAAQHGSAVLKSTVPSSHSDKVVGLGYLSEVSHSVIFNICNVCFFMRKEWLLLKKERKTIVVFTLFLVFLVLVFLRVNFSSCDLWWCEFMAFRMSSWWFLFFLFFLEQGLHKYTSNSTKDCGNKVSGR